MQRQTIVHTSTFLNSQETVECADILLSLDVAQSLHQPQNLKHKYFFFCKQEWTTRSRYLRGFLKAQCVIEPHLKSMFNVAIRLQLSAVLSKQVYETSSMSVICLRPPVNDLQFFDYLYSYHLAKKNPKTNQSQEKCVFCFPFFPPNKSLWKLHNGPLKPPAETWSFPEGSDVVWTRCAQSVAACRGVTWPNHIDCPSCKYKPSSLCRPQWIRERLGYMPVQMPPS